MLVPRLQSSEASTSFLTSPKIQASVLMAFSRREVGQEVTRTSRSATERFSKNRLVLLRRN